MTLEPGTQLGPYRIVGPLGAGGMGEVYEALDTRLDRKVAVKVLPEKLAADEAALARFEREAKAVAALSHPGILSIFDVGRDGAVAYVVMELLDGETLRRRLEDGALPPRKTTAMARQIALGLAAAHEKGIVHRDLKPENLFVTLDGNVKILDFGLAVQTAALSGEDVTQTPTREQITTPGTVVGTAGYMSPEQVRGLAVDHRSDVFSLGSVIYEMLTGRRAFHGQTSADTMTAILREDPPEVTADRGIPPALDRIVRRCIEKRPEERFHSAHDLAFALENAWNSSSTHPAEAMAAPAPAYSRTRRAGLAALLLLAGVAAGALLTASLTGVPVTEPVRTQPITYSGRDSEPDASPDGRLIAFTSNRDGRARIWVKQYPGGSEAALTAGPDHAPRFSPDGTAILFVRNDGTHESIYRTPLVGGDPRKVIEDASEADWSPDGKRIAFLRSEAGTGASRRATINVANADGSGQRVLTEATDRSLSGIRWSPDGMAIAATNCQLVNNGQCTIALAEPESGATRTITPPDLTISSAAWAGASDALVYASSDDLTAGAASTTSRILVQDLRGGTARPLLWGQNLFTGSGFDRTTIDIVAPGTLVYTEMSLEQSLREVPIGETGSATVARTRGASRDRQPVYTPDGSLVVFSSNRDGNLDLWSMSTDGGAIRRLTDDAAGDWDPAIIDGGTKLLWSSGRGGNLEIWMANVDGSDARQISHDGKDAENPTATPDGAWIVYSTGNPEKLGIWKIRSDGSEATMLAPGGNFLPEVSPDGRYALFVTTAASGRENVLRVVEVASGAMVPFEIVLPRAAPGAGEEPGSGNIGRARWMPDGSAIVYLGVDDRSRRGLYVQAFAPGKDTSATRRRLAGFYDDSMTESFAISPDGTRLMLSELTQSYTLMVADGVAGIAPAAAR